MGLASPLEPFKFSTSIVITTTSLGSYQVSSRTSLLSDPIPEKGLSEALNPSRESGEEVCQVNSAHTEYFVVLFAYLAGALLFATYALIFYCRNPK
jgi:hypothetical protein